MKLVPVVMDSDRKVILPAELLTHGGDKAERLLIAAIAKGSRKRVFPKS